MHNLLVSPWQAALQLALLLLWAALLFGGFAFGGRTTTSGGRTTSSSQDRIRRMPAWTRLGSSLTLVVIAWFGYACTRGLPLEGTALLISIGMSLGFLGDVVLAGALPITSQPVVGGILAFGLGHIAYLLAILRIGNQYGLQAPLPRFGMLAVWLAIGLVSWYLVVFTGGGSTVLRLASLPYTLLLAGVAGGFFGLALQSPVLLPAATGAALFLVSDLLLAVTLFRGESSPVSADLVWLAYGPGQALIVTSVTVLAIACSSNLPGAC
jgi:hypothetical protein